MRFQSNVAVPVVCIGDPIGRNEDGEARAENPKDRGSDARDGCNCPIGGVAVPFVQGFCPRVDDGENPANIEGVGDPNDTAGEAKPDVTPELDAVKVTETTGEGLVTVELKTCGGSCTCANRRRTRSIDRLSLSGSNTATSSSGRGHCEKTTSPNSHKTRPSNKNYRQLETHCDSVHVLHFGWATQTVHVPQTIPGRRSIP